MGLVTTLEYAEMAHRVYNIDTGADYLVPNFECSLFKEGLSWGATNTDFKGCVYVSDGLQEVVAAFQVPKLSKAGELAADIQIMVGMMPQFCNAALRLFERTTALYPNHIISLAGHFLGGGLAQVMGRWTGAPFVTFNAPGMWGEIQHANFLTMFPFDMTGSLKETFNRSPLARQVESAGRNFCNELDPVSAYGTHYGSVTRFPGSGLHAMDDILERIRNSRWADINPFDPNYTERGEL